MKVRRLNMFKHFINYHLRGIALLSLVFALVGAAIATPRPAAAADCGLTAAPVQCVTVTVAVVDAATGIPINNAEVVLIDSFGNKSFAYQALGNPDGRYVAMVTPGQYTVYVSAPSYMAFKAAATIKPVKEVVLKAPLEANSFD